MSKYDFSSLNPTDLEELVCDLLNRQNIQIGNGVTYKIFKEGKDKGIDFRYSSNSKSNEVVGQVKHYLRSGYDQLLKDLTEKEKPKVEKLNPDRYIFATSVDLSVFNVVAIYELFKPFIISQNDIYGQKNLNQLLEIYPDALDNQFKLWFSGSEVLRKILHYEIIGRSQEFTEMYLKNKLRLFVKTDDFDRNSDILSKERVLIITGDPGMGKTTLAEMLLYDYIRRDYSLTYVIDDIREVEKAITPDDSPQIFYYDDFLGHNAAEIQKAKAAEAPLIHVINRILRAKNKFFIMTTRTVIFDDAVKGSQRLRDLGMRHFSGTIKAGNDNTYREQLLQNHIDESDISEPRKEILSKPNIRQFIVSHKNFTPRSVAYVTNDKLLPKNLVDFESYVYDNFNNPEKIWIDLYEQQLSESDRLLINTMYSLGDSVSLPQLEKAFTARIDYEIKHFNFSNPAFTFRYAFRKICGGLIIKEFNDADSETYKFQNPSIVDFLKFCISDSTDETNRITSAAIYPEQLLYRFYPIFEEKIESNMPDQLQQRLLKRDFEQSDNPDRDKLLSAFLIYEYCTGKENTSIIASLLNEIDDFTEACDDYFILNNLKLFIEKVTNQSLITQIKNIGIRLFEPLIDDEWILNELVDYCRFIYEKFDLEPSSLLKRNSLDFSHKVNEQFFREMEDDLEDLKTSISDDTELEVARVRYESLADELDFFGLHISSYFRKEFNMMDWYDIILHNQFRHNMENDKD